MRMQDMFGHRPVTAISAEQVAWLGPVEAARQRKLLQVGGQAGGELVKSDRRRADRRVKPRA